MVKKGLVADRLMTNHKGQPTMVKNGKLVNISVVLAIRAGATNKYDQKINNSNI